MTSEHDIQAGELAGRIKSLEQFTGSLVSRRERDAAVIPIDAAPASRVPVPRRSRVFLRNREGHGAFADLTLTAPRPRPALD